MSVLSDKTIARLCNGDLPMIEPFFAESIKHAEDGHRIASYGVSSYGYDLRAAGEFKLFKGVPEGQAVDYKNITEDMFETVVGDKIIIPPHGFILTRSVEYVRIPRNVLALCIGKSTIARVGINCLCTPIEPEWEGHITFEFHNTLDQPNTFYANEGVLQLVFIEGDEPCITSYADRGGKYQGQGANIVLPKV
ncbi:dCTP deaminase [Pseudomonas phage PhiPA3]|uniref:Deoxycytidine triphosphate deaminase n=1 Tax=Pseudomonas phage PhiPA3 TaxID=998086 RepID=F8SJ96_BPPA3|nr:dCTP deaminase [Pseudomonas phage PhiPA3]AEH03678.1 deoxycytidine triphosphate deaminase [Pseudomonas phage PhiPA3]